MFKRKDKELIKAQSTGMLDGILETARAARSHDFNRALGSVMKESGGYRRSNCSEFLRLAAELSYTRAEIEVKIADYLTQRAEVEAAAAAEDERRAAAAAAQRVADARIQLAQAQAVLDEASKVAVLA